MGDKSEKYREIFSILETNLQNFLGQVSVPEAEDSANKEFNLDEFWANIFLISGKLGFEANKSTILWINEPLPSPEDMHAVCGALELACVALLNGYHSFPGRSQGATIKKYLETGVKVVLESAGRFASILQASMGKKYPTVDDHPLVLQCGVVMRNCDALKQLPKCNSEAVATSLLEHANLIKDALRELEEAKSSVSFMEDFECDESWTDEDHIVMSPMLGMIKTAGALTKKTLDAVKKLDPQDCLKIDVLIQMFARIPERVDDLALSLYPPLELEVSKREAWVLKDSLEEIIKKLHDVLGPGHMSWLEFILKAVRHNTATIQGILIQQGMANLQLTGSGHNNTSAVKIDEEKETEAEMAS